MKLRDILRIKGTEVHAIPLSATLADVVDLLVACNCGSLVVCEKPNSTRLIGIITERDILRSCAGRQVGLSELRVADVMTRNVITGELDMPVNHIMGLMTEKRIRHLPILEDEQLVGIISIGDIVKAQHDALTAENHALKSYIHG